MIGAITLVVVAIIQSWGFLLQDVRGMVLLNNFVVNRIYSSLYNLYDKEFCHGEQLNGRYGSNKILNIMNTNQITDITTKKNYCCWSNDSRCWRISE